ncbi:MAG: molecular chaperone [Duodenibacillus sp.]
MTNNDEQLLMQAREQTYRLLSGFYLQELTEETYDRLRQVLDACESPNASMQKGWEMIRAFCGTPCENPVEELACDYARVFLGAGCVDEVTAYPFESVYTSPGRLVCQDAYESLVKLMKAEQMEKASKDLMEDHLALEFTLAAHYCQKAAQALESGKTDVYQAYLAKQEALLKDHLLVWVSDFAKDINQCARTDFYRGVALLTLGWLEEEKSLFSL